MKQGLIVDKEGIKRWYKDDQVHRVDGPAEEWPNGTKEWLQNGQPHRTDGPAIEWADGTKWWYICGIGAENETQFNDPEWRAYTLMMGLK